MTHRRHRLRWIPHSVSNLMHDNGINGRGELSPVIGIGRTAIYQSFDENWGGYATTNLLAAIAGTFRIPPSALVTVETEVTGRPRQPKTRVAS